MAAVDVRAEPRAHRRFDPMSTAWPVIVADICAVLLVTSGSFALASAVADGWMTLLAYNAVAGVVLTVGVALPLRHFLLEQRRVSERRETVLVHEVHRREFDARLSRALDMAGNDAAVLSVTARAFAELAPEALVEVLLADSSQAHLTRAVASSSSTTAWEGCSVTTPDGCPAVRSGHTLTFDDSDQLDACPHLTGRSHGTCGAVCVPVTIMGSMVGVVHAVDAATKSRDTRTVEILENVAHQLGGRMGVLTAMAQSEIQANTDPLTGLLNRRSLENEVRSLARTSPIALLFADLDHFKQLNDTFGHEMGDRALRLFALTLQRTFPPPALVARHGGEEFVIVMPDTDVSTAVLAFERARHQLATALVDGRVAPFTVSAGIADTVDHPTATLDELIAVADAWLLDAKSTGRDRASWGPGMDNVVALSPAPSRIS